MKKALKKQQGFTLIEMLAALIIAVIIVTPMYIVTRSMSQRTDASRMENEAMQRARMGVDTLILDLSLAGMHASPNTEIDPFSRNRDIIGSSAQYRSAAVHLNRGLPGNDALLLTGNFLGGDVYTGFFRTATQIEFYREDFTERACATQFDASFANAHVINASNGTALDAKVEDAVWNSGKCELTLRLADLDQEEVSTGDEVHVSANQTALYWVEPQGDHHVLVRYFVDYYSPSAPGDNCTVEGAMDIDGITLPGNSQVAIPTRQVIAEYVEDFQVWFRPATREGTTDWISPHHYPVSGGSGVVDGAGDNFTKGFMLSDEAYVFPRTIADDPLEDLDDLSCEAHAVKNVGAEHVRSAFIRLSVRTERTDQSLDGTAYDLENVRIAAFTLKPYEAPSVGPITDAPGSAYLLKTLVTEAPMPNLAARPELAELE